MTSKVVLRLGDAELEVEGDDEFIAKRTEEFYKFAAANPVSSPKPAEVDKSEAEDSAGSTKKRAPKKRATGPSCASRIEELKKDEDFFSQPRTSSEIGDKLSEKATPYEGKHIAAALISLTQRGALRRVKGEEGKWQYVNP
jgi:hypothetical protein